MRITIYLLAVIFLVPGQNALSQERRTNRSQHSDADSAWVSADKTTPAFAEYQIYPTPSRGEGTNGSFMIYLPREYPI